MYVYSDISTIEWLSIKLKGSATVQIEYETTSVLRKQWACAGAKTASLTFDFSLWATVNTPVHEPTRSQGEDKANTALFLVGIKMLCILGMFCSCTTFFLLWLELASLTAPLGLSKNDETYVSPPHTEGEEGIPSPHHLKSATSILDCTRQDHFEVLALDQSCLTRFKTHPDNYGLYT